MYSRPGRRPATIGQVCEGLNAMIKVVEPNATAKTGQAADARATYTALEEVRSDVGIVRTETGAQFAALTKKDDELESRVVELEKTGPHVEVVDPDAAAVKGQAADARATYGALETKADKPDVVSLKERVSELERKPSIKVVVPNLDASSGQAADARATYEALQAEKDRSQESEAALKARVTVLEEAKSVLGEQIAITETRLRYDFHEHTESDITLMDRASNYIDATALSDLRLTFPPFVEGKARDFLLVLECSATPPSISYESFITLEGEDGVDLTPEEGANIYVFTEISPWRFMTARKLTTKLVENAPVTGAQLLRAMDERGIESSSRCFGDVMSALNLVETNNLTDAVSAVMKG